DDQREGCRRVGFERNEEVSSEFLVRHQVRRFRCRFLLRELRTALSGRALLEPRVRELRGSVRGRPCLETAWFRYHRLEGPDPTWEFPPTAWLSNASRLDSMVHGGAARIGAQEGLVRIAATEIAARRNGLSESAGGCLQHTQQLQVFAGRRFDGQLRL